MPFNPSSSLTRLLDAPIRDGRVVWLGRRPLRRTSMEILDEITLVAGRGIEGDHYNRTEGGRQVTLIAAEALRSVAAYLGRTELAPEDLRRNIVTEGINLAALKERRFRLGKTAVLETSGECHPCSRMEEILGEGGYNAVRGLGGITARVISSGVLRVGDPVIRIRINGPSG